MTELAASTPRPKRRRWLFVLLPLVLLGFVWWWSTRPAPLPKFLEPFADRISTSLTLRDQVSVDAHQQEHVFFVQAPLHEVALSLAKQTGMADMGFHKLNVSYTGTSLPDIRMISMIPVTMYNVPGTLVHVYQSPAKLNLADGVIGKMWPKWLDLRLGERTYPAEFNLAFNFDLSVNLGDIERGVKSRIEKARGKK
ncbi:MAG: hypothetical protein ABL962_11010 [Fimbriimonadaceae bacterium]